MEDEIGIIKDQGPIDVCKKKKPKGIYFSLAEELDDKEINEKCKWFDWRKFDLAQRRERAKNMFISLKKLYEKKSDIRIIPTGPNDSINPKIL